MLYLVLSVLAIVIIIPARAAADPPSPGYVVERWSGEQGLPNNAATSVVQVRDGYLWISPATANVSRHARSQR